MMRFLPVAFLLIFLLNADVAMAQLENIWPIPGGSGIDFNSGTPLVVPTAMPDARACASVCDTDGALLFYSDGSRIWDRNHFVMSNSINLTGLPYGRYPHAPWPTTISHNGAAIAPVIGHPDKYYVIATAYPHPDTSGRYSPYTATDFALYYSVVDMKQRGGDGDVVAGQKGILLFDDDSLAAPIIVVAGENCNMWLLAINAAGDKIWAFEITIDGINPNPVISHTTTYAGGWLMLISSGMQMTISPDRHKLGVSNDDFTAVFDFDPATGIVTDHIFLMGSFSNAFSPDNTKFYTTTFFPSSFTLEVTQYDLSSSNPSGTATTLHINPYIEGLGTGALKLAPDGKIYRVGRGTSADVIEFPNLSGNACQYTKDVLALRHGYNLPNSVPVLLPPDTVSSTLQLTFCPGTDSLLLEATDTSGWNYNWNLGVTESRQWIKEAGIYIVNYQTAVPCLFHRDTIVVEDARYSYTLLGPDTVICDGSPLTLAPVVDSASYLWQDGSNSSSYEVTVSGTYWVDITRGRCKLYDTINVKLTDVRQNLGDDMVFCKGDLLQIVLRSNAPEGAQVLWSNEDIDVNLPVGDTGVYWVTVKDMPCIGTDTISVTLSICDCRVTVPSAFSPNNDGHNDLLRPIIEQDCNITAYDFSVYNRWGQRVFFSGNLSEGWDGFADNGPALTGTYMYVLNMEAGTGRKRHQKKGDVVLIR